MGALLGQMLPAALVGALAVAPITIVITLLMSKGGLGKALGFGVGLVAVFAVVGVIALTTAGTNAGSSDTGSAVTGTIIAVLGGVLLVVIQIGVIGSILVYVLARDWATRVLQACRSWLIKNNRVISIVLGLVIGVWFIIKGVTQIAG
jgi:hypothetical protein